MIQFVVPQFIEREARIIGPLTFKQFLFIGGGGAAIFVLNFLIPSRTAFLVVALIIGGLGLSLAFLKIKPYSLPTFLKNALSFLASPKLYVWQKKMITPNITWTQKPEEKKEKETIKSTMLKVAGKSRLKDLSTKIETNIK